MITRRVEAGLPAIRETTSRAYKVTLTDQAADILGQALSAITLDPHKTWPEAIRTEPQDFESSMFNAAPPALAALAVALNVEEITSFDLLHGMTGLIERICPFDKPVSPSA